MLQLHPPRDTASAAAGVQAAELTNGEKKQTTLFLSLDAALENISLAQLVQKVNMYILRQGPPLD